MTYAPQYDRYYSGVLLATDEYSTPYPNPEEADRAGAILRVLSLVRVLYRSSATPPRILDVGCGRGWLTNLMSVYGECEGLEPASGAAEFARTHFTHLSFTCGLLGDLLARPTFVPYDIVVSSEVIEHVRYGEQRAFAAQLASSVRAGGHCIITTPRGEIQAAWRRSEQNAQPVEDWLTEKRLQALMTSVGMKPVLKARAHTAEFTRAGRVLQNSHFLRATRHLPIGGLHAALEYLAGMYQVWCFEKLP